MKDFILNYWREILEVVAVLVSIIICCIKKRPVEVVDTLKECVIRFLPYCINEAEKNGGSGQDKKTYCLCVLRDCIHEIGYDLSLDLYDFAAQQVEIILSTPQKKGVTSDEK